MMSELTHNEYWTEIRSIADELVSESMIDCADDKDLAEDQINDYRLHEWIDGHQWVIYTAYNLEVIKHSDNEDYYSDNFGAESLAASLDQGGLSMLHCHIAFWCMHADVQDTLESAFDDYENSQAA